MTERCAAVVWKTGSDAVVISFSSSASSFLSPATVAKNTDHWRKKKKQLWGHRRKKHQLPVKKTPINITVWKYTGYCRKKHQSQPDLHRELQIPVGTAGPPPRAPDPSGHCRTSTATSRSQWALPGLHCERQIPVGTAGPSASSRSQWALPDLNRDFQIEVGTAGPQPRLPDCSGHCRTSTATSRSQWALLDLNGKNVRKNVR